MGPSNVENIMNHGNRRWLGLGALAVLLGVALNSGEARGALRSHWMKQQTNLLEERGPLVVAHQNTGIEMQVSAPGGSVNQDRLVRILDRREEYAYHNELEFSWPVGAQLVVNGGTPQSLVWVDAPLGEPDYFMGWILASDLLLWDNSGDVTVWDGDGHTLTFALRGVF
ncbi:MAG TPA: hypothetical protein QF446_01285 [Planctomycetota bacterium]|nr:hypothetical protein [Planctomycetota bacterium]